jgi:hypothetical protein
MAIEFHIHSICIQSNQIRSSTRTETLEFHHIHLRICNATTSRWRFFFFFSFYTSHHAIFLILLSFCWRNGYQIIENESGQNAGSRTIELPNKHRLCFELHKLDEIFHTRPHIRLQYLLLWATFENVRLVSIQL